MNERLEAFRKRLNEPKKRRSDKNWQQWIGSPTAWAGLILSSVTAFYTFLYHSDELSVVIDSPFIKPDGENFKVRPPPGLTFINSGSRPVVVTSMKMLLIQRHYASDPECDDWEVRTEIPFAFEQTVVKPYDALSKTLKFENEEATIAAKGGNANRKGGRASMLVCIRFELAATDAVRWQKTVTAGHQIERDRQPNAELQRARFDTRPKILMKRNRFWTEVDRDPKPGTRANEPRSVLASAWSRILRYLPVPYDEDRNWSLDPPI
ncbi:hypothetical protein SAMN05192541_124125 [Bradyrhizobium arachidis]|nr:hypothetical protein SAMN05192541_124125 [Bradyrhizobium arachidis]